MKAESEVGLYRLDTPHGVGEGRGGVSLICICWPSLKAVPRHVALVGKGLTRAIHWCRSRDFWFTYKGETILKITDLNRSSGQNENS